MSLGFWNCATTRTSDFVVSVKTEPDGTSWFSLLMAEAIFASVSL